MKEQEFVTYQKIKDLEDAKELSDLLKRNNIEFLVEDESAGFDPSFSNNQFNKEYRVKLRKFDFEKVDALQIQISAKQIEAIGKDYYLYEFTDLELIELIAQSDKWSKIDFVLAQKILKDRGKEVNQESLDALREKRIEELAKPEKNKRIWIVVGYLAALLGGLFGFFIGWHLLTHKKTLPNGKRVYGYREADRKHGIIILCIATVSVIFSVVRITLLV